MDEFFETLEKDYLRVTFGPKQVAEAFRQNAIKTLLITDKLFRSPDYRIRQKYIKLTEDVERNRGNVFVISSLHPSGKKLNDITGIACILRFPFDLGYLDDESQENG